MNPYEVLGVPTSATMAEVEARYRSLMREHHPDLHHHEGPDAVASAEAATQRLNNAMAAIRREIGATGAAGGSGRWSKPSWSPRATTWDATTTTSREWPGENPFWRPPSESPGSGYHDDYHESSGQAYDWFGEPVSHRPDDPVPCPFCGRPYDRLDDYEHHLLTAHHFRRIVKPPPTRPGLFGTMIGKLRFIPLWFLVPLAFANWKVFGLYAFTATLTLVALVLYTQTSPRFRGR